MKRDFKGIWIPKEVWESRELTVMEKLFLVEIDSLDNEDGCYATNAYFSEFFGITKGRCTQIIKGLEAKTLITIDIERSGKQIKKRTIKINNCTGGVFNKLTRGIKYIKQGYLENAEENNTYINNTGNKGGEGKDRLINNQFKKELVEAFNQTMGLKIGKIRAISPARERHLTARIREDLDKRSDIAWWQKYFGYASTCPHLIGMSPPNPHTGVVWKASFDWLINPNNMVKVLEKKYEP